MKKTHIIGIIFIAVILGALSANLFDAGSYANFAEAFDTPGKEFHVVGAVNKEYPVIYQPQKDPNLTIFHMVDQNEKTTEVHLAKSKPQNFDVSEQVVLIGEAREDGKFHASDILLKCPSKYEEDNQVEPTKAQTGI